MNRGLQEREFLCAASVCATAHSLLSRFICYRKESKPRPRSSSGVHSAARSAVEPTQDGSPSELLALCSGQFDVGVAEGSRGRVRHLSDSSGSQAVRELLGLPPAPKPRASCASSLLVSTGSLLGGVVTDDTTQVSQMNEVLGLCSGVFQTTSDPTAGRRGQVRTGSM